MVYNTVRYLWDSIKNNQLCHTIDMSVVENYAQIC